MVKYLLVVVVVKEYVDEFEWIDWLVKLFDLIKVGFGFLFE